MPNQFWCFIMSLKFSSPREEALEIALQTRTEIRSGKIDATSTLRSCLIVATNLNKSDKETWIKSELNGYENLEDVPKYRNVSARIYDKYGMDTTKFKKILVEISVHTLNGILNGEGKTFSYFKNDGSRELLQEFFIRGILSAIIDNCLYFLNEVISELQYGGVVEYLMEEIRKDTDVKLIAIDPIMGSEIQSLFNNLTSTNKADWNKVGHSCRKLLKLVADKVFPASDELYTFKDKTTREVKDGQYINRLCAYIDQKTSDYERSFELSEMNYFEKYLRESNELDNVGEHKESIEKYQANMIAIHTYLIISEILRYYQN
jgi:hypothetical protein